VPQLLSLGDVAARVRVSKPWIFEHYKKGALRGFLVGREPGAKRGGRLLFREADVIAWLEAQGMPR
jgi:predicted DNA-binding transcriptional regulator AlpA